MALGTIPPWLDITPETFIRAGSAGAEAGLGSARTALEAESIRTRAAQEARRLSQAEHMHALEMQTRQEIAEQNRLRENQQMAIQSAYHTAQIGIAKERVDQAAAIAAQKEREAALQFADEQGFTKEIAGGTGVPEAMSKFPRTRASIVNALRLASPTERQANVVTHPELPGFQFLRQPSGQEIVVKRPEHGLSEANRISVQKEIARLEREQAKLTDEPEQSAKIDQQIQTFRSILEGPKSPASTTPSRNAPLGWEPTEGGESLRPILPPAQASQPAPAANPYKVGRRYKTPDGVMKYKGGDPNLEESWEKE